MKVCTRCGEAKPATDYYKGRARCKPCVGEDVRAYRKKNKDKCLGWSRDWRKRNPDAARNWRLGLYGLTQQSFDALLARQNGRCAICRNPEPGGKGQWHIDHDHSCCPGERSCGRCVRGLLCWSCNAGIGMFKDDPERIARAVEYVRESSVERT